MSRATAPAWVDTYFGADYRDAAAGILTPERTAAEVSFILDVTGLRAPATAIDLGCGQGRHTIELARRGLVATGVDLNADALAIAGASVAPGLSARFVRGDYASPPPGPFDLVLSLFGSFGFGADDENERALLAWCRRVRPGGWMVLELWHRDLIVSRFEPARTWRASDDLVVEERRAFDPLSGRLHVHYGYAHADGRRSEHDLDVRLYTAAELRGLLARGGVEARALHGSLRGDAYSVDARSLVLVGRRA